MGRSLAFPSLLLLVVGGLPACGDDASATPGDDDDDIVADGGPGDDGGATPGDDDDDDDDRSPTVEVQVLALNDFHGNLEPPNGTIAGQEAGGVGFLGARLDALRATAEHTVLVSAGDLIGASPLLSGLFHDEPTIEAMNLAGLTFNAVGNHELDEGPEELLRMASGGCHPVDGCYLEKPFGGADFAFLGANVITDDGAGEPLFPPFAIREFDGVPVAFIGMTLEGTPDIVSPEGTEGLAFLDEADTANALVADLVDDDVRAIVVLIHEGGFQSGGIDDCAGISGPIVDIVQRMDDEVDVVVTGHTHRAYNCVIDGRVVTSAASFGRVLTEHRLTVDRATGQVFGIVSENTVVSRTGSPRADLVALVDIYDDIAAPLANRVLGTITATIGRGRDGAGQFPLGNLIADAQLSATAPPGLGNADVAFMNPGGVRDDLRFAADGDEENGEVTFAEAFSVQPFGNSLVTMTLSGEELDELLEAQWRAGGSSQILQVSEGFTYRFDSGAPVGSRVDADAIRIDGVVVQPTDAVRVTVNSFLAGGGDGFPVLAEGRERLGGAVDVDALADYLADNAPVAPPGAGRVSRD